MGGWYIAVKDDCDVSCRVAWEKLYQIKREDTKVHMWDDSI